MTFYCSTECVYFNIVLILYKVFMCVSVPFSKLHEHACPYCCFCIVVGTKDCLQTNYGDPVKFIAAPTFMCVSTCTVHKHASSIFL